MKTDMRTPITIKQPTSSTTTGGEIQKTWSVFASAFASAEPILGKEFFQAEAAQSEVEVKFRTYYISGVTTAMRVNDGTTDYEIISAVNVKGLDRELLMYCKKAR